MASWQDITALPPVQTAAPGAPSVSLAEMRMHARIDADDEDLVLAGYITAATRHVEKLAGHKLVTQTWTQSFSGLADRIYLHMHPVSSVSSVTYYDSDNASQTLTSTLYRLVQGWDGNYIARDSASTYPDTYERPDAVTVTMVAGYGASAGNIPDDLRHAVMLLAAQWYESREDALPMEMRPIPNGVMALVAPHRRGWM